LELHSRPHWATGGAYSAPQTPYLDFRGPTSKGSEGRGRGEKGKGRGRNEKGKEREAGPFLPSPFPIRYATGSGEPFEASQRPGLWVSSPGLRIF